MVEYKADRVGQQLGSYRLTRLLGAGGFGEVYEADHRLLQQKRAIKLLLERHFHDPAQRERFLREARTLAALDHPNILPVLEVGEEGTVLYLVMSFYRRGTLNDLLKQHTTVLPLVEVERFLAQMCAAVGYAHARNIAHLDLKPENVLLHEDGRLVLSDFGLAHLIKQGRLEAGSSASWGTPYYMAPEQIRGEPELRSDLYALGIILFQLLTTQYPFTGNAPEAVMMKHLLEAPPPLRAVSPAVPATLEPVIQKALKKQPEDRYATAEALLADFRAAVSSPSPRPTQPPVPGVSLATPMPQVNDPAPAVQPTAPTPPEHVPHPGEPANMTQTTGTGPTWCEIKLDYLNYSPNCGQIATGRCTTCGRAFCDAHRGYEDTDGFGKPYVHVDSPYFNMCEPCSAAKRAEERERQSAPIAYFQLGTALTTLRNSGVQPVKIYDVIRWTEEKFLITRKRERAKLFGRGWVLGKFTWGLEVHLGYGEYKKVSEDWLTVLMDADHGSLPTTASENFGLVRVQPYSDGYEVLSSGTIDRFGGSTWSPDRLRVMELAGQAVKKLAGV